VGGPDLMPAVLDRGRPLKIRHFLFGSQPHVIEELSGRLRARYPGVEICGSLAPAANSEESELSLDAIRSTTPDIVWVALGAPKQEAWMRRHAVALRPALLIGVGAAFDFAAGTRNRAPRWMQRVGLEWLHRLGSEPERLFRRYLVTNSAFLLFALPLLARGLRARFRPNIGVGRG
jgi:N-acetylglucosaminyldiphosphoundecaprenol N-acetyl-beta-D-mannosaminyltransferase